jgi:hypothetical protein
MRKKLKLWWFWTVHNLYNERMIRLIDENTIRWEKRSSMTDKRFRLSNKSAVRKYIRYQNKMKAYSEKISKTVQDK